MICMNLTFPGKFGDYSRVSLLWKSLKIDSLISQFVQEMMDNLADVQVISRFRFVTCKTAAFSSDYDVISKIRS